MYHVYEIVWYFMVLFLPQKHGHLPRERFPNYFLNYFLRGHFNIVHFKSTFTLALIQCGSFIFCRFTSAMVLWARRCTV